MGARLPAARSRPTTTQTAGLRWRLIASPGATYQFFGRNYKERRPDSAQLSGSANEHRHHPSFSGPPHQPNCKGSPANARDQFNPHAISGNRRGGGRPCRLRSANALLRQTRHHHPEAGAAQTSACTSTSLMALVADWGRRLITFIYAIGC